MGIKDTNVKEISLGVSHILADTYTLYLKTQNYHWNVTGPRFHQLHGMFEEQYTEMATAIDDIAERIRALGHRAPGTFKEFMELTSISESTKETSADEMVSELISGHESISRKAREAAQIASKYEDEATADMLISRIHRHDKTAWMLRSILK